jgi:potassium efflux system protein
LLAFLPNLQNRLSTITELHAEIDRRFAAADIQIPFPQRDIHVRDGATLETTLPSSEQATG